MIIDYWKERSIDEKWRFYLPSSIRKKFKDSLFLAINKEDVVVIVLNNDNFFEKYLMIIEVPIEKNNRITIPAIFRKSVSFFFEKIDLIGFKDRLEIWPCP